MAEQILDGTGTGQKAKVDNGNRLHTHSVSENLIEYASSQGDSYNINTGTISLTSGNQSGVLYFKNNGNGDIQISSVGYLLGTSTGGSGDLHTTVLRNPSLGTVISEAVDVDINQNKNVGSSKELNVNAFKGGEAKTITDGVSLYHSLIGGTPSSYVIATGTIVIPKGGAIGVLVTPQSGNTSMDLQIFMAVTEYKLDL